MKTGSVIQRVALLIMVVALGVAMMACEAAAGKAGEAGEAGKPGGVPPQLETRINDVSLTDSGSTATVSIDLSKHFWDPNSKDSLTFTAQADKPEVVSVSVKGSALTLAARAVGTAIVTVTAKDKEDLTTRGRFNVTVTEAGAPVPATIPNKTLYKDDGAQVVALGAYFTHAKAITYSASALPVGVVTVAVTEANLTITPSVVGQAIVTVTATADGKTSSTQFEVDVVAGTKPKPEDAPIAPVGHIKPQTVEVGKTVTINTATSFSKTEGVTYTATSSAPEKATVAVDAAGVVTITGVEAGNAQLTVDATDADGAGAAHIFPVEVVDPLAPYKPDTVTIEGITKSKEIRIDAGQTLRSLDIGVVSVSGSGTAWTLKGEKKGKADVRINNADLSIDKTIKVTVNNTPPKVKDDHPRVRLSTSIQGQGASPIPNTAFTVSGGDTPVADDRWYHKVDIDFAEYFSDADGFGDIEDYNVKSLEPFVEAVGDVTGGIVLDVIKDVKFSFAVEIAAVDKDGSESGVVVISVTSTSAHPDRYDIAQDLETGRFDVAKIWKRIGVRSTVSFMPFMPDGTTGAGFNFIAGFHHDLLEDEGRWFDDEDHHNGDHVHAPATVDADARDALLDGAATADAGFYFITATDPVESPELTFSTSNPALGFELESNTPEGTTTATVTITYHVVTCIPADFTPPAEPTGCHSDDDTADRVWDSVSKTLTMNIVPSREAYEE